MDISNILSGLGSSSATTTTTTPTNQNFSLGSLVSQGIGALSDANKKSDSGLTVAPTAINPTFNLTGMLPATPAPSDTPKDTSITTTYTTTTPATTTGTNNKTLLYVGIGVGILVVGVILYFVIRKH